MLLEDYSCSSFDILNISEAPDAYNDSTLWDNLSSHIRPDFLEELKLPPLLHTVGEFIPRNQIDNNAITSFRFPNNFEIANNPTEPYVKPFPYRPKSLSFQTCTKPNPKFPLQKPSTKIHDVLICKYCKQKFSYRNTLLRHERLHSGEKHHHCQNCFKSFSRKDILLRHQTSQKCRYVAFKETFDKSWLPETYRFNHLLFNFATDL